MFFQIYKILKTPYGKNSHRVCLDEQWTIKKDCIFQNYNDACEYIIDKNFKKAPESFLDGYLKGKVKKEDILNEKYLIYNSYFIDYPPIEKIKKKLKNEGIKIVNR